MDDIFVIVDATFGNKCNKHISSKIKHNKNPSEDSTTTFRSFIKSDRYHTEQIKKI